jgi:hypothetical protein
MHHPDFDIIDPQLADLLEIVKLSLHKEDCDQVREYITVGESGLALELICTQLVEYEASIVEDVYIRARSLGQLMEMPEDTWLQLLPLVVQS